MFVLGFVGVSRSFRVLIAISDASVRKRQAETWEEWSESVAEVRRCKRRRVAWLRSKEVVWWDAKAQQAQDRAGQGDAFGVFATFKELRLRGSSLSSGEIRPAEAELERDAWAEHFRMIGEGAGSVDDRVWSNVPSYPPMDVVWETLLPPTSCMQLSDRCP